MSHSSAPLRRRIEPEPVALPFALPPLPGWEARARQLYEAVEKACAQAQARDRRASRLTVEARYQDGRLRRRSLLLPRATSRVEAVMPAALGLLRLLLRTHGNEACRLGIRLEGLVEGAAQPIRFERFLARRKARRWSEGVKRFWGWLRLNRQPKNPRSC